MPNSRSKRDHQIVTIFAPAYHNLAGRLTLVCTLGGASDAPVRRDERSHAMTTHNDIETVLRSALQMRYEDAHLEINLAEKIVLLDSRRLKLAQIVLTSR